MAFSKVVLKSKKNEIFKGTTNDFSPAKASFHLIPIGQEECRSCAEIVVNDLKAVFFVKDFGGTAYRDNYQADLVRAKVGEKLVKVKFHDGEEIYGIAQSFILTGSAFLSSRPIRPAIMSGSM